MNNSNFFKLRHFLIQNNYDAFLVTNFTNVRYLSGFTGTDCWLLITPSKNFFLGDFRYLLQGKNELKHSFEIKLVNGSIFNLIKDIFLKTGMDTLCFEETNLTVAEYHQLKKEFNGKIKLVPTKDIIEEQRQLKTENEIKLIQTAVKIAKKSLLKLRPFIKKGVTELFLKNKLEQLLRTSGAQAAAFDIIVASGPNSAMPHAKTTKRKIKENEPILIDAGADFCGYKSDLTRTFFLGKINRYTSYYELVVNAQDMAIKLIRPGVKIQDIDQAARAVFKKAKLDRYFGHALGHGIGLEVHEAPHISGKNKEELKAGMVFTVEPALYIPNWGGIRTEDIVVVTEKGAQIL